MGPDAHTASLFPGEPLIDDHRNLAAAVYVEKFHQWRVTLLPAVLEAARNTLMLAAGDDKAEPLRAVLHEPYDPKKYPAQIATHDGRGRDVVPGQAAAGTAERLSWIDSQPAVRFFWFRRWGCWPNTAR